MLKTLLSFDYSAHARFVAPARERSELWRLIVGLALATAVIMLCSPLLWQFLSYVMSEEGHQALYDDFETLLLPQSMLVLLYSFGLVWIAVAAVVIVLHLRRPETLIGSPTIAFLQAKFVVVALLLVTAALMVLPPYGFEPALEPGLPFAQWAGFLLPALVAVFIQTSAEEVLFRGYIQQQLAARFNSPFVWMMIPSLLFGLAHYAPQSYGSNAWLVVIWATVFGVLAADLTARSGTLGPAIAMHFVNNIAALLIIAPQGEMSGLALFHYPFDASDEAAVRALLPIDFAMMLVTWLAARLALRR
ncbi:lysostaphin resistance A-like protein [Planktotalea sp.]|uniref:CPBP family intramembrane glutamic endopeptidase n=1 Tax=Planktotalea sp. TaxID=2029877 RepID=UPI003F6C6264